MTDIHANERLFTDIDFHLKNGDMKSFYICNKCGSTHIKEEIMKDFADTERDVFNESGDLEKTEMISVDSTLLICEKCDNEEVLDY